MKLREHLWVNSSQGVVSSPLVASWIAIQSAESVRTCCSSERFLLIQTTDIYTPGKMIQQLNSTVEFDIVRFIWPSWPGWDRQTHTHTHVQKLAMVPHSFPHLLHWLPGYYDNTNFHRNIKGFMIQAGASFSANGLVKLVISIYIFFFFCQQKVDS